MQVLDLTGRNQINLSDIRDENLQAVALTVVNETLSQFLDRMTIITERMDELRLRAGARVASVSTANRSIRINVIHATG